MKKIESKPSARTQLLDAALSVIRAKGYSATTVDDLCAKAGVTKGAFFHHFESKEALAVCAAEHWATVTTALFDSAPYRRIADPLKRLLSYLEFRKALLKGTLPEFTCLVGTLVQETYDSNPAIRDACHRSIFGHSADVAQDIEAAKKKYAPNASWSSKSLALHIQAVIQGSFILAKSAQSTQPDQNAAVAAESLTHLSRYVEFLFSSTPSPKKRERKRSSS